MSSTKYLRIILQNLWVVVLSISIFVSASLLIYFTTTPTYQIMSLIRIDKNDNDNLGTSSQMLFGFNSTNMQEEARLYKSRTNIKNLIDEFNLNLDINNEPYNHNSKIYFNSIDIHLNYDFDQKQNYELELFEDFYNLSKNNVSILKNLSYNTIHEDDKIKINLIRSDNNSYINEGIRLSVSTIDKTFKEYFQKIKVSPISNRIGDSSLLEISLNSIFIDQAKDIIDRLNEIYVNRSIIENSERAESSLEFLEARQNEIELLLEISENKLRSFQQQNLFFEQADESKVLFEKILSIDSEINKLRLQEVELKSKFRESSPVYTNLIDQIELLIEQKNEVERTISLLPETEKEYLYLLREVEVNQNILEVLLNRSIEFSIMKASTLSDIKIIDSAYTLDKVSPQGIPMVFFGIIFGGFIGLILVYFRANYFSPVNSPSELLDEVDVKMLGIIPFKKHGEYSNSESEMIKSLFSNLLLDISDKTSKTKNIVLIVTGAVKGVGKSHTSMALAKSSAERGLKTLLIDLDFKQGDIHKNYQMRPNSYKDFVNALNNQGSPYKATDYLDIIFRPSKKASESLAIFSSDIFQESLRSNAKKYDFVILDTPPMLSVTDTLVLSGVADFITQVSRHKLSKTRDIIECNNQLKGLINDRQALIYNGYQKPLFSNYKYYDYYAYKYYGSEYNYDNDE